MKTVIIIQSIIIYIILSGYNCQIVLKQTLKVGQTAKLKCGPINKFYNIPITFKWEKPLGNVVGTEPELKLTNVDFKDGGIYTCRVSQLINNQMKESTLATELLIKEREADLEPPVIYTTSPIEYPIIQFNNINEEVLELWETDYLYSKCNASNWEANEYTVQWIFNQIPVLGTNNILFISPLDINKDAGYYTCRITHNRYPDRKYEKQLLVNIKKPEFLIKPSPDENLKIGGRIHRRCELPESKVSRNEPLQYSWLKNGHLEIATGDTLNLNIVDDSVNGDYSCVVKSLKTNKSYSKDFSLKIDNTVMAELKINIYSTPSSPEIGKEFKLKCEVNPPIPNPYYRWKKDNVVISSEQTVVIPAFQKKDIGSYSCEIVTATGQSAFAGRSSSEHVLVKFLYSPTGKIELDEAGGQVLARLGEKREMHCEIPTSSNSRGKDVLWLFNNQILDDNLNRIYNIYRNDRTFVSILTLARIHPRNEGQYTCRFDNLSKKVNLLVSQEDPSLSISPETLMRYEGEAVEFHCQGNSIPDFSNTAVRWSFQSRDGKVFIPSLANNKRWEIINSHETAETSFISVSQAKVEDDGFYTCTATNGMQKSADLIVKKREDPILLTISPESVTLRTGQPVVIECFSISRKTAEPHGEPRFTMEGGQTITDPRIITQMVGASRVQLSVTKGLRMNDNKMKIECHAGSEMRTATIHLENQCATNYRRCNNGECQPSGKFCNGIVDCSDGSDEVPSVCNKCDPLLLKCEHHRNRAPMKDSFLVHWKCDGENDCGNDFDEGKCSEDDLRCGYIKFNCSNGKMIPRAYQCDKESDCPSGEDEIGCRLPQFTSSFTEKIRRIPRGRSTELRCESYGVPRPFIVWRHNWGCLRDNNRMQVVTTLENCNKIISTLRITNFQPGDDGIYNCENLSGPNRGFSDDYQLILDSI